MNRKIEKAKIDTLKPTYVAWEW